MDARIDALRDLRLGLYALESGAIDQDQLVSAVRAWSRSGERPLSEILVNRRVLDAPSIARIEARIAEGRESPAGRPPASRASNPGPSHRSDRSAEAGPAATVSYAPGNFRGIVVDDDFPKAEDAVGGAARGRFRVLRPHARGGLGEVFLAFDGELNRSVALKELQARLAHDPGAQGRFLREAEITGRLEHPGIVPVYSLGRHDDGRPYYAMRFIEGETLNEAIEKFHRAGPAEQARDDRELAFRRLLRCVIDACNVIAYAHSRGVVHRDLKPENIMLGRYGETLVVDWGLAKSLEGPDEPTVDPGPASPSSHPEDASMTRPGSLIGTPRYMSPEQASGDVEKVGKASDIYSLGAILYCLLVGQAPFAGVDMSSLLDRVRRGIFPAPRRLRRTVNPTLEATCLKAMATDPGDRHAAALDLARDLEAWQADVRYRGEQELALREVQGSMTRFCLDRAHNCFANEAVPKGLLWMARALENVPDEPPELPWAIRTSLSGWHLGTKLMERSFRHSGEIHWIAFCPESRRLATASADGIARLWDISTSSPLSPPLKHDGPVRTLDFAPDGTSVATAGDGGIILRWDGVGGKPLGRPLHFGGPVAELRFSPDGSRIFATGGGGFSSFEVETGRASHEPDRRPIGVHAIAWSPDGSSIAVASEDGRVRLIRCSDALEFGDAISIESPISDLAFDPGGSRLLIGCLDGSARLRDLSGRSAELTLKHPSRVTRVGFRPDGGAFSTASGDGTARLWETATGRPIGEPLLHQGPISSLAFRPDGTIVATGSEDGTVKLWCAMTGLPIGPPLLQKGAVGSLFFSPDGRRLAIRSSDTTVRCWTMPNPIAGDVERIVCWVGVTTELEFDEGDAIRKMDGATNWELRRRLGELGGPVPAHGRS